MLGMKNYPQAYIDGCRSKINADLAAYRDVVAAAGNQAIRDDALLAAISTFETRFFNTMVLVLDELFVHRLRTVEGKDGNPLNEVRVMGNSMMQNNNVMTEDTSIRLLPKKSVLKYQYGDDIKLTEADFSAISEAFFAEIERKFA